MASPEKIYRTVLAEVHRMFREYRPPLDRVVGTVPGSSLPPTGNTGTGYTPADNSVTTGKIADGAVTILKLAFDPATQAELDTHAAIKGDVGTFGHVKPDGATIVSTGGILSTTSAAGSTTLLGLTDVPDSYSGQALKTVRVKTDETGVEFVASTGPTVPILLVTPGSGGSRTWASMPAAETEIFGSDQHELYMDLSGYTQALIQGRFGGGLVSGMQMRVQYSLNDGGAWSYLDGATGPSVAMFPATSTPNIRAGSWVNLATAAKTYVLLRPVGVGGNGTVSPTIGQVVLLLR